jgi:hypothetical protein
MAIQPGTFMRLPGKEAIVQMIEEERRHLFDLTSYLWYIMPVAERFGDQAYAVAAEALTQNGVPASATLLKALAEELKTPEGLARHAKERELHITLHVCG